MSEIVTVEFERKALEALIGLLNKNKVHTDLNMIPLRFEIDEFEPGRATLNVFEASAVLA